MLKLEMTLKNRWFLGALLVVSIFVSIVNAQKSPLPIKSYLPLSKDLVDWCQENSARIFVGEELYSLIDGGADLYLEYGFRQVVTAEYKKNLESSVKLEIYEMADDDAAFGLYSITSGSQGKQIQIGDEGTLSPYSLVFWKSHFLVILSVPDTTNELLAAMVTLAAEVDLNIRSGGERPLLLARLSNKELITSKFIRGPLALSSLYMFDTKDIFHITEGVVGYYPAYTLFLFRYKSGREAGERFLSVQRVLSTGNRFSGFKKFTDRCSMTDRTGNRILVAHIDDLIAIIAAKPVANEEEFYKRILATLQRR